MRYREFVKIKEHATSGATSSGNVATAIGKSTKNTIGSGFDSSGDKGIYNKKKKPNIIRR